MDENKDEEHRGLIIGLNSISEEWDYWARKATLIAEEVVPLMNGCDPKSWRERDSRDDGLPGDMIAAIERGLKIAEDDSVKSQSPADWLAWGKKHGLDQPTMRSENHLRLPDVRILWPMQITQKFDTKGLHPELEGSDEITKYRLDRPAMRSEDGLRLPDVSMWPLFADAVEKTREAKKEGKSKAPPKFLEAFNRLLCEIDKRLAKNSRQIDRKQMPGTKEDLHVVALKYDRKSMTVELQTFDEYIAGVVSFKKGRPPTGAPNPYAELFPEYFPSGAQKTQGKLGEESP